MPRDSGSNPFEERLLANIERCGWHCNAVVPKDGSPQFAYTVGLAESFGHPELVIYGLDPKAAHSILSEFAARASITEHLRDNNHGACSMEGDPWRLVPVTESVSAEVLLSALWYYNGQPFQVMQVVWPDADGRFPWDSGVNPTCLESQPLLGVPDGD